MRSVLALVIALLAVAVATPVAGAGDTLVRPGKGIGRINLGISDVQLRRVMGKPEYVIAKRASFGRRVVEYQFGLAAEWTVTLRGPRGGLRVVSVATALRRERTPDGFGVGTPEPKLIARYGSRLRCQPYVRMNFQGLVGLKNTVRECVLGRQGGPETVFLSRIFPVTPYEIITPDDIPRARVIEVAVRAAR